MMPPTSCWSAPDGLMTLPQSMASPVGAQFLAQDLRHRGRHALPHLVLHELEQHFTVRRDPDEIADCRRTVAACDRDHLRAQRME